MIVTDRFILDALEIIIPPYVGHGCEGFREAFPLWPQQ